MVKVKVSEWLSDSVSEWQDHLLSCSGHLEIHPNLITILKTTKIIHPFLILKKVCISNILKTQGAKIVFTNLELLIEFKSKCFRSIRFWFVRKSIHVNLWILIWFDRGFLLYFIFYILPGIAGARYFCTKYWDWDRNINNKDRNTYVGADQGERWWKLNHLGEHLRMQSGEKPTKYLLAHF